jgi:LysM repeat protein
MIHEIIFAGALFFHPHAAIDSIGTETVNGKLYVIHKVDEKETLYAISRRYGASVDAILQSNPGITTTLEVGQILKVPYEKKTIKPVATSDKVHKVAPRETMYSISKTYGVTVDEIKKWNNLTDNTLSVGQELIVGKAKPAAQSDVTPVYRPAAASKDTPTAKTSGVHTVSSGETLFSIARQYGVTVAQLRSWNDVQDSDLKVGQDIFVAAPESRRTTSTTTSQPTIAQQDTRRDTDTRNETTETPRTTPQQPSQQQTPPQTIRISESLKNSDEIVESGIAELIEGTEGNRKYLALHRTAPVGTILKVRNEMNNREVFVRVMGKLPESASNDKLVIRLSRSAYDRLGAIDPRFRVELTYYK